MDLHPSEDDEAIRAATEAFLRDNAPITTARSRPDGFWPRMAEMGWFSGTLPEAAGGVGLSHAQEALVFVELGRVAAPVGAIAGAMAAQIAAAAAETELTASILSGAFPVGLGFEDGAGKVRVLEARGARIVALVRAGGPASLYAVDQLGEEWRPGPCLDPTTSQAIVATPSGQPLAESPDDDGALRRHLALLLAAMSVGVAQGARDMGARYASLREQFGRPIGVFQGVKHPCADMAVRCSTAHAQMLFAALSVDADTPDVAFQVQAAKRLADLAAVSNARTNIQVHGGIGMTDDADPHVLLKRAHTLQLALTVSTKALLG